ncbi:MAG: efflux RND transporter periplasmic adaptor subunit [Chloroflexi bacterium OHK40]
MKPLLPSTLLPLLLLLAACGTPAAAQQAPTPTPMPPAPALERPTYTVQRGSVERLLEVTGRVIPVDLERLSFRAAGRVAAVNVRRGDTVQAGDILAEIVHDEALEELAQAEVRVAQAERDLELARQRRERAVAQARLDLSEAGRNLENGRAERAARIAEAELALRRAEEDLARLTADGPESLIAQAERDLQEARDAAKIATDEASEAKTRAQNELIAASEAVAAAQQVYSDAFWDYDWVQKYGTHPREKVTDPATGAERHRRLDDQERVAFQRTFEEAERKLRAAERELPLAERAVILANEAEARAQDEAARSVAEAERALELLRTGQGSEALTQARRRVEDARLELEQARRASVADAETALARARLGLEAAEQDALDTELRALEEAQLDLERARRSVDEGRVIAPRDGTIVAVGVGVGDSVEPYEPVVELADPSRLELAAELTAEQMRELAEGQPAEARLVARPDLALPANVRRLPAPYGSGGSGAVAEQDRTTRFDLGDAARGLESGALVRISVVLERREDVLWLPPEAIRSFEGRRFIVVREGDRERRVVVRTGIESVERVEILEGVDEGDVVVGP